MTRKYLDSIGAVDRPDTWDTDDIVKMEKWKRQRALYGFDEREIYDLDTTFYLWLYERLKMYVDIASKHVDLTSEINKIIYKGKEYTQAELIKMMLERLECGFVEGFLSNKNYEYIHEIEKIWAIILPFMWW